MQSGVQDFKGERMERFADRAKCPSLQLRSARLLSILKAHQDGVTVAKAIEFKNKSCVSALPSWQ